MLAIGQQIKTDRQNSSLLVGELSLNVSLKSVRGAITHDEVAKAKNFFQANLCA